MGTKPVPDPPPFLGEGEASWRESHEHHCCQLKPGVHPGLWSNRVKFWKSNTCKTFHQQTMIHLCRSTCSTCPYGQPMGKHIFLYMSQCRRLKAEEVYADLTIVLKRAGIYLLQGPHLSKVFESKHIFSWFCNQRRATHTSACTQTGHNPHFRGC